MYWADKIADQIVKSGQHKPYWVDDMKTPSGRIHVGSLRGVLIHDFVHKALMHQGKSSTFTYVYNDMDPMDALPGYLDKDVYTQHMGKPLYKIPAPEGNKSFAQYYADEFTGVFNRLGATPKIVLSHELYESGQMNPLIQIALDNVEELKHIYRDIAHYELEKNWYPFQVFCEHCGKEGSTTTYHWDGEYVYYRCEKSKVEWAVGCGHEGKVSPFNGTGKFLWKVDWPAHWKLIGITIEGAGKDHTSAGGSRDMAREIVKRVFKYPEPYDIPYEWLLIRGAKMSSSKGIGASAKEFADLLPPEVGRFLFARTHCNTVIDFDLVGNTIPDLFDEYDKCAQAYFSGKQDMYARIYEASQVTDKKSDPVFLPRFRDVAMYSQMPSVDLIAKFEQVKGSILSPAERHILEERVNYAKKWIKNYAPSNLNFQLSDNSTQSVTLNQKQKDYLGSVIALLQKTWNKPEDFQFELFEETKRLGISAKEAFAAIYQILLGKNFGPKAAWFLLEQDKEELIKRFSEVIGETNKSDVSISQTFPTITDSKMIQISTAIAHQYPSVHIGFAIIRGIQVVKTNEQLEQEKETLYAKLKSMTTEEIGTMPEILSYRKMYKQMGVDWHSRRPSPEALLRRIVQGKDLYAVNTCVDAYNLIVMKYRVSVGTFDLKNLDFPVELCVAKGGEKILLLGNDEETEIKAGEVYYQDQTGPYNLDYNYRDSQRVSVNEDTEDIMINVDGVYDVGRPHVERALKETLEIIKKYCGGVIEVAGIIEAK